jgi:hypothetical protein
MVIGPTSWWAASRTRVTVRATCTRSTATSSITTPREALFQGSGRVVLHDNILVDAQYTAIALRAAELPLKLAYVYNNTVYTSQQGVYIGTRPTIDYTVVGNLIFAGTPLAGDAISGVSNLTGSLAMAANFVNAPSFTLGAMDFYPRVGMVLGPGINLTRFVSNADYTLDFNQASKNSLGSVVFRGAYAGQGLNPGWKLQAGIKPVRVYANPR